MALVRIIHMKDAVGTLRDHADPWTAEPRALRICAEFILVAAQRKFVADYAFVVSAGSRGSKADQIAPLRGSVSVTSSRYTRAVRCSCNTAWRSGID